MRSPSPSASVDSAGEVDLRAVAAALRRRRRLILMPTLLAFVAISIAVNVIKPRYTAESQVLLENQETFFTRPDRVNLPAEQMSQLDQEAVASQVQLISSRDLARRAIKQLHLAGNPEFDPLADGISPVTRVLVLLGVVPDPTRESGDSRIVTTFLDKLTVFSPPKTRVISIQFTSRDADLAAKAANTVAQLYLQEQSAAKRATARVSAEALAAQVSDLRSKLSVADDDLERYRLQTGLLTGSNNMTISGQQLVDINSDLSKARSSQADAEAKASLVRELIRAGKESDVADVINNDIVRRVSDQRVVAEAQLARESRTLMSGHPRIKELTAQLAEYDRALRMAAKKAATTLETEARIAGQRVANLESTLARQKKSAGVANADEVQLRALERIAQSYKDQLESSTTKYQEALARETSSATPSDARIISGAARPQDASFPKKVPFIVFGTVAAFVLAVGFVAATELLSVPGEAAVREDAQDNPVQAVARVSPVEEEPSRKVRGTWTYPEDETTRRPDGTSDPVFASVVKASRPSREGLRSLAGEGMLAATFAYLRRFGRSAADTRAEQMKHEDPATTVESPSARHEPEDSAWDRPMTTWGTTTRTETPDLDGVVEKIVAAHVPGRGLVVVGAPSARDMGPQTLIELGRILSGKGRTIMLDLNRTPAALADLAANGPEGVERVSSLHGLAELLSGDLTFAEVIHRDQGSRLHFIPTGLQEADFRDFDLILDALTETYDFVALLAPGFPHSEIAKVMAPYADIVVLAVTGKEDDAVLAELESELIKAGAREVLRAGADRKGARQAVA